MEIQAPNPVEENLSFESLKHDIDVELEQSQRSLKEVNLMLDQSQTELAKLTQRNAAIASHLQQVQDQFETMPRADIRMAYNAALDVQQRLLLMRSQLEKLQSDQVNLQKFVTVMEKIKKSYSGNDISQKAGRGGNSGTAVVEMIINAQESERQRLSRQMHDGPAQTLSNFIVQAEIATRLLDVDPTRAKDELNNLRTAAMTSFQKVRDFIFELRPMMLDDLGMVPTIRKYLESYKEQSAVDINIIISGEQDKRLEPYLEVMVFRALQELVGNAVKQNMEMGPKLKIKVQMNLDRNLVKVSVVDNGKGFDPQKASESSGLGIKLIRERVEMLGGSMEIDSAPGQGCKVTFQVPSLEVEK
jgi:two-component system, NarL family, sensor histidine kinase DegS